MSLSKERDLEIMTFLARSGWQDAERESLPGDASTRRYERLREGGRRAILMDAPGRGEDPPCPPDADPDTRRTLGWNAVSRLAASRVDAFIAVARHLKNMGLSAPAILAADPGIGLAIVEDFGDGLFASHLASDPGAETPLYAEAGRLVARLQSAPAPDRLAVAETGTDWPLLPFDAVALAANIDLFAEWLPRCIDRPLLSDRQRAQWEDARSHLVQSITGLPFALTLRDYHAENLLWLPEREGLARIGLIDFQDAVIGPRAWDLSMLLHDARRDVSPAAANATLDAYALTSGTDRTRIEAELALAGLANTLRILGIFCRLVTRDAKPRYGAFMPRMWAHLSRILATPGLQQHAGLVGIVMPDWRERVA